MRYPINTKRLQPSTCWQLKSKESVCMAINNIYRRKDTEAKDFVSLSQFFRQAHIISSLSKQPASLLKPVTVLIL
ncbi:hypothetical protein CDL12_19425 [Handroanthus impetiginosus]|uniref:Uncharacterized protein n=1 Tax=Handroanthus impetiginosus TaxID=429701 RepID=A0A2G9GRS0_9LAMI|nr:hypothetical protein CDL12_19425 [Handroanthus impetiginosus]